ncbi:hypothetical protein V7034_25830 [Priestia megaterium]
MFKECHTTGIYEKGKIFLAFLSCLKEYFFEKAIIKKWLYIKTKKELKNGSKN